MDSCAVCLYQELRGIIVRGIPDENSVLKRLNVNGIDNLVNDFFNINKGGVVAAFWGVDLLDYARIYDLDNSTEHTPHFNLDSNGKIIIPDEVCGSAPSDPRALKETVAMKQLLEQSIALKGWQTAEDREDKYYIVTPYHGCCRLGKGGYKIDLTELERSVLRP